MHVGLWNGVTFVERNCGECETRSLFGAPAVLAILRHSSSSLANEACTQISRADRFTSVTHREPRLWTYKDQNLNVQGSKAAAGLQMPLALDLETDHGQDICRSANAIGSRRSLHH